MFSKADKTIKPQVRVTAVAALPAREKESKEPELIDLRPPKEKQELLQRAAIGTSSPAQTQDSSAESNRHSLARHAGGLPIHLKNRMEALSGYSLNDVQVHYQSSKPAQLRAYAYAQGNQIHLGPGQEKHLAHETWHVIQQKQGRVKPTVQLKGQNAVWINNQPDLEKEADQMAALAKNSSTTLKPEGILHHANVSSALQRKPVVQLAGAKFGYELQFAKWRLYELREDGIGPVGGALNKSKPLLYTGMSDLVMVTQDGADVELVTQALNIADYKSAIPALATEITGLIAHIQSASTPIKLPLNPSIVEKLLGRLLAGLRPKAILGSSDPEEIMGLLAKHGVIDDKAQVVVDWKERLGDTKLSENVGLDSIVTALDSLATKEIDGVLAGYTPEEMNVIIPKPTSLECRPQLTFGSLLVDTPAILMHLLQTQASGDTGEGPIKMTEDRRQELMKTYDPKQFDHDKSGKLADPTEGLGSLIAGAATSAATQTNQASMGKDTQVFMSRLAFSSLSVGLSEIGGDPKKTVEAAMSLKSVDETQGNALLPAGKKRQSMVLGENLVLAWKDKILTSLKLVGTLTKYVTSQTAKPIQNPYTETAQISFDDFVKESTDPGTDPDFANFVNTEDHSKEPNYNIPKARDISSDGSLQGTLIEIRKFEDNLPLEAALHALGSVAGAIGEKHLELNAPGPGKAKVEEEAGGGGGGGGGGEAAGASPSGKAKGKAIEMPAEDIIKGAPKDKTPKSRDYDTDIQELRVYTRIVQQLSFTYQAKFSYAKKGAAYALVTELTGDQLTAVQRMFASQQASFRMAAIEDAGPVCSLHMVIANIPLAIVIQAGGSMEERKTADEEKLEEGRDDGGESSSSGAKKVGGGGGAAAAGEGK